MSERLNEKRARESGWSFSPTQSAFSFAASCCSLKPSTRFSPIGVPSASRPCANAQRQAVSRREVAVGVVEARDRAVEREAAPAGGERARAEQRRRLLGHVQLPLALDRRDHGERGRLTAREHLALEGEPARERVAEPGDLERDPVAIVVHPAREPEAHARRAEPRLEAGAGAVVHLRERAGALEEALVEEPHPPVEIDDGDERVRGVAEVDDRGERDHLGRGEEHVRPLLLAEEAVHPRELVRGPEPGQVGARELARERAEPGKSRGVDQRFGDGWMRGRGARGHASRLATKRACGEGR